MKRKGRNLSLESRFTRYFAEASPLFRMQLLHILAEAAEKATLDDVEERRMKGEKQ